MEDMKGDQPPDPAGHPDSGLEGSPGQFSVPTPQATLMISPIVQAVLETSPDTQATHQVCHSNMATLMVGQVAGDSNHFRFVQNE